MSSELTLHLVQWRIAPGDLRKNLDRSRELIASASPDKGDLVILPEMFPSGFDYRKLNEIAGKSARVVNWMGETASRYGIGLAGSIPTLGPEGVSNTMKLVDGTTAVAASYDKIHLFFAADEDLHFTSGDKTVVARWGGAGVGLAICFDLRFPEITRKMCDQSADMVVVSAQWPRARVDHFMDFVKVRAMENQFFVAACNSTGDDGKGLMIGGRSMVAGPSGEVKGVLGEEEAVLRVAVDLDEVEQVRSSFPVLKVRRWDLFGKGI